VRVDPSAGDPVAPEPSDSVSPVGGERSRFVARHGSGTLGARLERDRLEDRAARLDRVVGALRARARAYDDASVPAPLNRSLSDFQGELAAVQAMLAASRGRPSGQLSRRPENAERHGTGAATAR
jgi:anti-sigma factor RsiW